MEHTSQHLENIIPIAIEAGNKIIEFYQYKDFSSITDYKVMILL